MRQIALTPDRLPTPARSCAGCTACCVLPEIDALQKPADVACRHCAVGEGCRAYAKRPVVCQDFRCLWLATEELDAHWQPSASGMLVYRQGEQLTVLVDESQYGVWRQDPYAADLARLADEAEAAGGYLILFCGPTVERIRSRRSAAAPP